MIDVKGNAFRHGDGRDFVMKQKMMWIQHKIYVNKVIGTPPGFFKSFWLPDNALTLLKRKGTKKEKDFLSCPSLQEYLNKGE